MKECCHFLLKSNINRRTQILYGFIEALVLWPSKFHKKINTQGGHKHCQTIRLDVSYVAKHIFKSIRSFLKNYLNTIEIARDLGLT